MILLCSAVQHKLYCRDFIFLLKHATWIGIFFLLNSGCLLQRLQELYLMDPAKYSTLTEIVEKEVKEGTARKVDSCARAVLWLAR